MGGGVPWQNGGSGGSNHWPVTYDSRIDQASISTESANCSAKSSWRFGDAELGLGRHSRRACRRRGGYPRPTRSDFDSTSGESSLILADSRQLWTEELSSFDQSIPSEGPLQACSIVGLSSHAMVHRNPPLDLSLSLSSSLPSVCRRISSRCASRCLFLLRHNDSCSSQQQFNHHSSQS